MEVNVDSKVSPGNLSVNVEVSWGQDGRSMSKTSAIDVPISEPGRVEVWWLLGGLLLLLALLIIFRKVMQIGKSVMYKLKGQ